jgi:hypothetical protein
MQIRSLAFVLAVSLCPYAAGADADADADADVPADAGEGPTLTELTLVGGEVVSGELVKHDDKIVVIKRTFKNKAGNDLTADITYQRDKIAKMVEKKPGDEYSLRSAKLEKTPAGHVELARWCLENHLEDKAHDHAKAALAIDKDHAEARALLESEHYVEIDGAWLSEAELMEKKGLVKIGDKLMTKTEAEEYKRKNATLLARNGLRGKFEECQRAVVKVNADIVAAKGKQQASAAAAAAAEASCTGLEARVAAADKQIDAASDQLRTAQKAAADAASARNNNNNNNFNNNGGTTPLNNNNNNTQNSAVSSAQGAVAAAKKAKEEAGKNLMAAQRKAMPMKMEAAKWKKTVPELEAKQKRLTQEQGELKIKLDEAEKALAAEEAKAVAKP